MPLLLSPVDMVLHVYLSASQLFGDEWDEGNTSLRLSQHKRMDAGFLRGEVVI